MQRAMFLKSALVFSCVTLSHAGQAQQLSEQKTKCNDALNRAYTSVLNTRNSTANNLAPASTQNQQSQSTGNPITDMVNKMAENNMKKAELVKQQLEQERQINTEQFKQITAIEDKEREIIKEKSKLPIEINNSQFERRKQEAEVRMKCSERANKEYTELVTTNGALASRSQYAVTSLSQVSGTRNRMRSMKKVFYDRCMAEPATQEALQLAIDQLDTKLYNFKIQAGIHNSDLEYTKSKIPKLVAHMDDQRRYVAQAADIQMNALDQAQQMQMMGLGMALMTSAMGSGDRLQSAGNHTSADAILRNWENIKLLCMNDDQRAQDVPADLSGIFGEVNSACRPSSVQNPASGCVRSNGQPSARPAGMTTTR